MKILKPSIRELGDMLDNPHGLQIKIFIEIIKNRTGGELNHNVQTLIGIEILLFSVTWSKIIEFILFLCSLLYFYFFK